MNIPPPRKTWKHLGHRRKIFGNRFIRLYAQKCENLRSHKCGDFYTLGLPDCVCVIALNENKEMLLVRQYRHGSRVFEWELPGGCTEKHETFCEAAARELYEETGAQADAVTGVELTVLETNPVLTSARCGVVFFASCTLSGTPHFDPFESIELFLIPIQRVHEMYQCGEITHAFIHAALGAFFDRFGKEYL